MPKAAELRAPDPPDQGGVYFEVHTPGVYRDLFGTLQAFDPLDHQMPLALSLPAKVGCWCGGWRGSIGCCRAEGGLQGWKIRCRWGRRTQGEEARWDWLGGSSGAEFPGNRVAHLLFAVLTSLGPLLCSWL